MQFSGANWGTTQALVQVRASYTRQRIAITASLLACLFAAPGLFRHGGESAALRVQHHEPDRVDDPVPSVGGRRRRTARDCALSRRRLASGHGAPSPWRERLLTHLRAMNEQDPLNYPGPVITAGTIALDGGIGATFLDSVVTNGARFLCLLSFWSE